MPREELDTRQFSKAKRGVFRKNRRRDNREQLARLEAAAQQEMPPPALEPASQQGPQAQLSALANSSDRISRAQPFEQNVVYQYIVALRANIYQENAMALYELPPSSLELLPHVVKVRTHGPPQCGGRESD